MVACAELLDFEVDAALPGNWVGSYEFNTVGFDSFICFEYLPALILE